MKLRIEWDFEIEDSAKVRVAKAANHPDVLAFRERIRREFDYLLREKLAEGENVCS